jgi:hypothetical protein
MSTLKGKRDTDYLTARIARDRPDILERMKAGEFSSVRKAALEAGIVRPMISIPLDPDAAVRLIIKHFQGDALDALIRKLANREDPGPMPKLTSERKGSRRLVRARRNQTTR